MCHTCVMCVVYMTRSRITLSKRDFTICKRDLWKRPTNSKCVIPVSNVPCKWLAQLFQYSHLFPPHPLAPPRRRWSASKNIFCTHIYTHTQHTYIHTHNTQVERIYTHTHTHTYTQTHTRTHIHTQFIKLALWSLHTHTHTHTHTYTYTYTYTDTDRHTNEIAEIHTQNVQTAPW